jgi:hypothetical protein
LHLLLSLCDRCRSSEERLASNIEGREAAGQMDNRTSCWRCGLRSDLVRTRGTARRNRHDTIHCIESSGFVSPWHGRFAFVFVLGQYQGLPLRAARSRVVARLPAHHETSASDVCAYLLHVTVDCDFENLVVDVDNFTTSASAMR